jgi:hypothetical protein
MRFHTRLPKDNVTLMMLASFLIVILGISAASGDRASHHVKAISIIGAVALLVAYVVWLVDYIRSDAEREGAFIVNSFSGRTLARLAKEGGSSR